MAALGVKRACVETYAAGREILDLMRLFNGIFDLALARFGEIKAQQKE
jgi:hypothetical protein